MKQNITMLVLLIICIISIVFIPLSGCTKENVHDKLNNQVSLSKDISSSDGVSCNYAVNEDILTDHLNNNNISAMYPQLVNDKKDFSQVNQLIKDTVSNYLKDQYGENYTNLTLDISYQITFSNNSFISIVFEGLGNVSTAAHPNNVFLSLNIDLNSLIKLPLRDIYTVDDRLVSTIKEKWVQQLPSEQSDYLINYSDNQLMELLIDADNPQSNIYSYFTDKQMGISFVVPYAIGDHVEILINYDEIDPIFNINSFK